MRTHWAHAATLGPRPTHLWRGLAVAVLGGLAAVLAFSGTGDLVNPVMSAGGGLCAALNEMGFDCQLEPAPSAEAGDASAQPPESTVEAQTAALGQVDLSIAKTASPDPVIVGRPLTYTITVTNNGPSTATAVVVTDKVPSGSLYASCTPWAESCSLSIAGGTVTWRLGSLPNGATATLKAVVVPTEVGPLTNTASVTATEPDPDSTNNTATRTVTVQPPSADPIPQSGTAAGGSTTYSIVVTNRTPTYATGAQPADTSSPVQP